MDKVVRPQADDKKIHNKNEFELCYLRHQYVRKAEYNPSEDEMKPFEHIIRNIAKNTYSVYRNLFILVGLALEDIANIGRVHLVSFLGLFSLDQMPEKYNAFIKLYEYKYEVKPNEEALLNKNKANFTLFLKQRMEDLVRVCRQKARNIKGLATDEFYAFVGSNRPPRDLNFLSDDYTVYGFKKIDVATFKSIRKRNNMRQKDRFELHGLWYIAINLDTRPLNEVDLAGAGLNPHDSIHNKDPEQILFHREQEDFFQKKRARFRKFSDEKKMDMMNKFIEENENNNRLQDEVNFAKKTVQRIENKIYLKSLKDENGY